MWNRQIIRTWIRMCDVCATTAYSNFQCAYLTCSIKSERNEEQKQKKIYLLVDPVAISMMRFSDAIHSNSLSFLCSFSLVNHWLNLNASIFWFDYKLYLDRMILRYGPINVIILFFWGLGGGGRRCTTDDDNLWLERRRKKDTQPSIESTSLVHLDQRIESQKPSVERENKLIHIMNKPF